MSRLRPAGLAAALLVMTACESGGAATTTEPTATAAPGTSTPSTTAAPGTSAPSTTATPGTSALAMSDLEVIEAGVAAFYAGDAERGGSRRQTKRPPPPDRTCDPGHRRPAATNRRPGSSDRGPPRRKRIGLHPRGRLPRPPRRAG